MAKIQWNKVTWYSKTLAAVFFITVPFVGFYLGVQYGKMLTPFLVSPEAVQAPVVVTAGASYYSDPTEWQVDENNANAGFSIAYPIDFNAQDGSEATASQNWQIGSTSTGNVYFTLVIPKAFEPQTNLVDATLTIGSSKKKSAVTQCLNATPTGGSMTATSTAVVNGNAFTVFQSSDAAAGNLYQTTSYRTVHNGQCYAIEYTIHSSQIANYPASYNLKPFNQQRIEALMQRIIGTFKFE